MNKEDTLPSLSAADIDQILDPALSVAERQTAWHRKPLSVQARKVQDHWKLALNGPLHLAIAASALAFIALPSIFYSDTWWMAGATISLLWYPAVLWAAHQMLRLHKLCITEL